MGSFLCFFHYLCTLNEQSHMCLWSQGLLPCVKGTFLGDLLPWRILATVWDCSSFNFRLVFKDSPVALSNYMSHMLHTSYSLAWVGLPGKSTPIGHMCFVNVFTETVQPPISCTSAANYPGRRWRGLRCVALSLMLTWAVVPGSTGCGGLGLLSGRAVATWSSSSVLF